MHVRQNQASLSAQERQRFVAALLKLKADGTYDRYVDLHKQAMPQMSMAPMPGMPMTTMHMAHRNPWFLPWHREYLLRFEADLQKTDSTVSLPYWDWITDNAASSSIWGADFLGGDGQAPDYHVSTGAFAGSAGNWKLAVLDDGDTDPVLKRAFGKDGQLPVAADRTGALAATPYDSAPWQDRDGDTAARGFRWSLEHTVHDEVHMWVGGNMELATSPNDPAFFLHHCNVDRQWALWCQQHPTLDPYLPLTGAGQFDRDQPVPMLDITPAQVLNHHALGYIYDTDPQ